MDSMTEMLERHKNDSKFHFKKLANGIEPLYTPPDIDSFIEHNYWTILEAVCVLTGWPESGFIQMSIHALSEEIKGGRLNFYYPVEKPFDPTKISKECGGVFLAIKHSIEIDELPSTPIKLFDWNTHLVNPENVIFWFIKKGYTLPNEVQKAIKVFQMNGQHDKSGQNDKIRRKIINQITAQYVVSQKEDLNDSQLIRILTNDYGLESDSHDNERKILRRDINEIFGKGSRGQKSRSYDLKPIPTIVEVENGIKIYNIPLLFLAIETIARIKINEFIKDDFFNEMPFKVFQKEILRDKLCKKYMKCEGDYLGKFLQWVYVEVFCEYKQNIERLKIISKNHVETVSKSSLM